MSTRQLMEELRSRLRFPGNKTFPPAPKAGPPKRSTANQPTAAQLSNSLVQADLNKVLPQSFHNLTLLEKLKQSTPAKVGIGRAGLRYRTQTLLQFLTDFAVAKAAVESQVPQNWATQHNLLSIQTKAADPDEFLARPDLGRQLSEESLEMVRSKCEKSPDVQLVVGDGLSATAVMQNAPAMIESLKEKLERENLKLGTPLFVRHCRAKIMDLIGQAVEAKVGIILIGERPGLGTGDGMSAYLVWDPQEKRTDAEKQAISNIHRRGLNPEEAGQHAAHLIKAILEQQTSGVGLDLKNIAAPGSDRSRINQAHPEPMQGCGQSHGQQCTPSKNGLPGQVCHRSDNRPCEVSAH